MRVQGYIEIDNVEMSSEEQEQFNALMNKYMLYYYLIDSATREYYFCILKDVENLPVLFDLMSARNPILNGLWQQDGNPYGQAGYPVYPFDLAVHLKHTPTEKSYDDVGNIIGETPVTEFKPLHAFAGWEECHVY